MNKKLTRCTEGVAACELPHASQELAESSDEEGHPDDDVGSRDGVGLDVDEGQNERRGGERHETPARKKIAR